LALAGGRLRGEVHEVVFRGSREDVRHNVSNALFDFQCCGFATPCKETGARQQNGANEKPFFSTSSIRTKTN